VVQRPREQRTLWFVSEVFHPDQIGTAHFTTELAVHFAQQRQTAVLCGLPKYNARGQAVPSLETWRSVRIERCQDLSLDKNVLPYRVLNVFVSSLAIFLKGLRRIQVGDTVVVVTSPPLLPFMMRVACLAKRAHCVMRVDDVYPEVLAAAGQLSQTGWPYRALVGVSKLLYRSMDTVVVLGRDMASLARDKIPESEWDRIVVVPHFADIEGVRPEPRASNRLLIETGLVDKFVVQCAGNMGRAQAIETMFGAAARLRDRCDIQFLFIGTGAKRRWMERQVEAQNLNNVTLLDERPRTDQNNFLNACDLTMVSLVRGMAGAGVPSRMYNIMAAGKPIVAIAEAHSELACVVREEQIGWVVPPDDADQVAHAIEAAVRDPALVAAMGRRARAAVERRYSPARFFSEYGRILPRS
jgi:colanic acid biosynthesis glycosyl transferase WcaI